MKIVWPILRSFSKSFELVTVLLKQKSSIFLSAEHVLRVLNVVD